ncbi:helix-turn-helix domain-containing protein [Nonomuraea sp. NPDC049028]|uniref:helix-turn-helix domain-containing protein n=1 Tax=Nonomuraea sp. NPDC049028 TaxID=3364348 RepID=UPI0037161FA0
MTPHGTGTLTIGRGNAEGRISGYVLKVIRESTGLTQERFAERLGLDVTTIQGWESGRRPLMAISTGTYLSLRHWLLRFGVQPRCSSNWTWPLRRIGSSAMCSARSRKRPGSRIIRWRHG